MRVVIPSGCRILILSQFRPSSLFDGLALDALDAYSYAPDVVLQSDESDEPIKLNQPFPTPSGSNTSRDVTLTLI